MPKTFSAAVLATGILVLRRLLHRTIRLGLAAPRVAHAATPADLDLPFSVERIPTARRRALHGWLVAAANPETPAAAVIVIHGWGGNAGMMLPFARPLHEARLTALFIDARCHGASDDDSFASLPRFAEDIEHAWRWLRQRPDVDGARIAVVGHSVGAGAALLAASRHPEIGGVVSIAAFAHPATMMRRWLAEKHIPYWPLGRYILGYVERTIGTPFAAIAPENTIGRVRCPVLLVQGADDRVVPRQEAERIFAARVDDRVRLIVVDGQHDSFPDSAAGMRRIVGFLQHALAVPAGPDASDRGGAADTLPGRAAQPVAGRAKRCLRPAKRKKIPH